MKKQTVIRTICFDNSCTYDSGAYKYLHERLNEGWHVVMCNPFFGKSGETKYLEYILEKGC